MTRYLDALVARSLGRAEGVRPSVAPLFANEGDGESPRQSVEPEWETDITNEAASKPVHTSLRRPADASLTENMIQFETPELSPLRAQSGSLAPLSNGEDVERAPAANNSPSVPRDESEQTNLQSQIIEPRSRSPLERLHSNDASPSSQRPPVPVIKSPGKDPVAPLAKVRDDQPMPLARGLNRGETPQEFLRQEIQQSPNKQTDNSPSHEGELVVSLSRVKSLLDRQRPHVQREIEHNSENRHTGRKDDAANTQMKPSEPTIQVTIGRIEVRAIASPPQVRKTVREDRPTLTLDAYLQRRAGERGT